VRIENTFALYVNRFGIFWKPLDGKLSRHAQIIRVTARLHNFSIDENVRMPSNDSGRHDKYRDCFQMTTDDTFGTAVLANRENWLTRYQFIRAVQGPNLRNQLADEIESLGYGRSDENVARNTWRSAAVLPQNAVVAV
jgi:hypothetical protein